MTDVLRRKLGASRVPKKAAGVTLEALLRKTMPRDADAVLSLPVSVANFSVSMMENAALRDGIGEFDLIYLLENEDGARGLAILDLSLTSCIVEVQVSGQVSPKPPPERPPTRTDGIVSGEIVDRWLDSGDTAAEGAKLEGAWPFTGFERAPVPIIRREAELLLEPVEFRVIDISLNLGTGDRSGQLRLAAPRVAPLLEQQENTTAARFRGHMPELPVSLRAVLVHLPVEMDAVRRLEVDGLLHLPDGCLGHVRLETRGGELVQEVRLGQLDGRKAVRLGDDDHATSSGALQSATALPTPEIDAGLPDLPEPTLPDPVAPLEPEEPLSDLPDLPPLPDSEGEGGAGLPDLPDLPELPELPDLPELPELP